MADNEKEQLRKYIEIEKQIQGLENTENLKKYDEMVRQVEDLDQTIKQMEVTVASLVLSTKKEKADVENMTKKSIEDTLKDPNFQAKLNQEQEEYLEALNKEEVMKQNLDGLKKQKDDYVTNAERVKGPALKLKKLYEERDDLLSDIFNGEYGSELENQLESKFDELMDKKQRVSVAHYKWTNARVLLQHAVNQLSHGVRKWPEVKVTKNQQHRYPIVTEVRNNLIAAMQNVNSTQRYLHTIIFPYCTEEEMKTLNRAIENIYTDANSPDRHQHAFSCFDVTMRRACALLQWFDNVIQNTIQKDLKGVTEEARQVETKLRAERVRLIRAKVEESGGNCNDLNTTGLMGQTDQQQVKNSDADSLGVVKPEHMKDSNLRDANQADNDPPPPAPTPVPLNALAPPPNQEEIFGNIEQLKSEHKKDTENFQKTQDINKARIEQGFKAKLAERRHRKTCN